MSTTPGIDALADFELSLSRYIVWSKKEQGAAIEDRARKIRFELARLFKAIAKTPAELEAEIAGLNYDIKRRPLSDSDLAANRSAYGKDLHADDTVVDMETEIKLRKRSLRFLSVSFLFRSWKAAKDGQTGRFGSLDRSGQTIGSATVQTAKGNENPSVLLTSYLEGAVVQNRQRGILEIALRNQAADMAEYIAKKHQEWLQQNFNKTYSVALGSGA